MSFLGSFHFARSDTDGELLRITLYRNQVNLGRLVFENYFNHNRLPRTNGLQPNL